MTRLPTALAVMALLASPLTAQERPAAILVLDGSGSMWGQIDGTAKITIAQDVIGGLMTTLPADLDLGLTVYGHRRKGDCADIETLVMPGPDTRGAITGAVNGIKPKGKTPMADAVVAAAKALRHTEEAATVILVSDGIETCVPDVCAVARALEETGVDFTAHVVGFGVDDPETLAQFQCMADSTGGQFLSAANAAQLSAALTEVAVVEPTPEPAPLPGSLIYSVAEKHGEASRRVDVEWSLLNEDGEQMITAYHVDFGEQDLPEGIYTLTVTRVSDGTRQEKQVVIRPNARTEAHFEFEAPLPQVTLLAPQTAAAGATISVDWTGPDAAQDYLDTAPVGAEARTYLTYTYTERGNPTALRVPAQPGDYEIRYVLGDGAQILTRVPLTVTPAEFALEAPATALAGATIDVSWTGSGYDEDYLSIASAGTAPNRYEAYTYVRKGNPAPLLMPTEPGQYEIRYITGQDTSIAVTRLIEVTALAFTLDAPESATAGSTIDVTWTGGGYDGDYLSVAALDAAPNRYEAYTYVRKGNPAPLLMPTQPGTYEIRYINGQDSTIATSRQIEITALDFSLQAPETASAGSTIDVAWTGGGYNGDYLSVAALDAAPNRYEAYTYVRKGNPAPLLMPTQPGTYEIRYINGQDSTVATSRQIEITALDFSLQAPETASAGSTIDVTWTGGGYDSDYLSVAALDAAPNRYEAYTYVRDGNPAPLLMPSAPGTYEIRYINGQDSTIATSRQIEITALDFSLDAVDSAPLGATIDIGWTGGGYNDDYLTVAEVGSDGGAYLGYVYVREGNPLRFRMPVIPGAYELRYINGQDGSIAHSQPISLTDVAVTLTAPANAKAGSAISVSHDGPDYDGDYVTFAEVGANADAYLTYTYTRDGSDLQVMTPDSPGTYELRYVTANGASRVLARQSVTVE